MHRSRKHRLHISSPFVAGFIPLSKFAAGGANKGSSVKTTGFKGWLRTEKIVCAV